jgi:hypothetical protein
MPQEPPTDEQQCQGWRGNSNKKALRLAEGGRLFLFKGGFGRADPSKFQSRGGRRRPRPSMSVRGITNTVR